MRTHELVERSVEEVRADSLSVELRYWPIRRYLDIYRKSLDDIEGFWEQES